jgi:hypothetical protein
MMNVARVVSTLRPHARTTESGRKALSLGHTRVFIQAAFGEELHAARVKSLANGVAGVLNAATVGVAAIGRAYAALAEVKPKSGVKQIDRMLGNSGIDVEELQRLWAQIVIAEREEVVIALDWTDFDDDDHTTLCAYVVTNHGRATPLAWKTVKKSKLQGQRTQIEHSFVSALDDRLPDKLRVTLLADRGFGDQKLYELLAGLGWDYVIRFRGCIVVEAEGQSRPSEDWVLPNGRSRKLDGARVTNDRAAVPSVVVVKASKMREPWCLATSLKEKKAAEIIALYGKRFTIEETFRDTKNITFGMGLSATHIRDAGRRDRLLMLVAVAHTLLTLLGAASEDCGHDRMLKTNTAKHRTMSLYNQGAYWFECLPTMREDWLRPLMESFDRILRDHAIGRQILGVI